MKTSAIQSNCKPLNYRVCVCAGLCVCTCACACVCVHMCMCYVLCVLGIMYVIYLVLDFQIGKTEEVLGCFRLSVE
jgi:hypothetical protein